MVEALLFLGELVLMGVFLLQVARSEKANANRLDGLFAFKDEVIKKAKAKMTRFTGA